MQKEEKQGVKSSIATQEEFNELIERHMDRGEEKEIFDLLQIYPDFARQYAGELEKELGL